VSREDVDVVRQVVALNDQRVLLDRDALERLVGPDFEFVPSFPGAPTYVGYEGVEAYHREMGESFETWSGEVVEIVDGGDGRVVATTAVRGHSRSGVDTEGVLGGVFEVRDGRVRRCQIFSELADAYAAVGLQPPDSA
jgi:ketosteroid isomerase-like protein